MINVVCNNISVPIDIKKDSASIYLISQHISSNIINEWVNVSTECMIGQVTQALKSIDTKNTNKINIIFYYGESTYNNNVLECIDLLHNHPLNKMFKYTISTYMPYEHENLRYFINKAAFETNNKLEILIKLFSIDDKGHDSIMHGQACPFNVITSVILKDVINIIMYKPVLLVDSNYDIKTIKNISRIFSPGKFSILLTTNNTIREFSNEGYTVGLLDKYLKLNEPF